MSKSLALDQHIAGNQKILLLLWQEILILKNISCDSDFFQLGGDSLQMMTLLFRISQETGIELDPGTVFENPTLGQLAAFIANAQQATSNGAVSEGTI